MGRHLSLCQITFTLSFCALLTIAAPQITNPTEVSALRAIKRSLVDNMKHLRNWNKGDPCTSNWTGILCFDAVAHDGYLHVQVIQLLNKNLSGNLAPEIGQLSYLTILDFMWNELSGSIPNEIGNISSLKLLLLNGNKLSGELPNEIGYLSNLTRLQVDENQLSGPLPESFSNLNSVRHIHLNNNSISGQIPPDLSKLTTLLHLLLDNNNLSGYIPSEFSTLPKLRILQLDNNNFSGVQIPVSYRNLSRLVKLSLRNCSLQGGVPDLSTIANLSYLDVSLNQLTGSIPSYKLSDSMTTINLSDNHLNGSIPESFSELPLLQRLSLENNLLSGSVHASLWLNKSFSSISRLMLDLRNNLLLNISGDPSPPENVTLRLQGNPICSNTNVGNINQFCGSEAIEDEYDAFGKNVNSTIICPIPACPKNNNFEYVPSSPVPCFCASPLQIGYRLKSPSFSHFPPHMYTFKEYMTTSLDLDLYQLSIDNNSLVWEKGPRLRMSLKLFPKAGGTHSSTFNVTEILRIREIFTSWIFPGNDFFGPYELLNFTLLGPYSYVNLETPGKGISKAMLIAVVLVAVVCAVAISAVMTIFITRRHAGYLHKLSRKHLPSKVCIKIDGVKSFTFEEMAVATNDFSSSCLVGQGGYGNVYRGTLFDKTLVAIKRAKEGSLQGENEFLTEIEMLSRLHHRNLVSLVGYCEEQGEQMLVYEFMPNGTLGDWLSAKSVENIKFGMRLQIALDSAKGILYLHTEASPPIFHRDIKASNILLDSKFSAKIADFGLSRLAPVMEDDGAIANHVSTLVKGTPGYVDPEYFLTHKLTDKSDVYSLGVVFLEMLTGMKPISHGKNIVCEVNSAHRSGTMFSIIDSKMGSYPTECVERFITLAISCCHMKPEGRPAILDIVRQLENILQTMPHTGIIDSVGSRSRYYGESPSSSLLHYSSRDPYVSSNALGSDLVSGVIPTIIPR